MVVKKSDKVDLSVMLAKIQKDQGLTIGGLREAVKPVRAYSTGNMILDNLTGVGGFPIGRISGVYGEPSAGKTTIAVQSAVKLQKQIIASKSDDKILFMDHEHAMSAEYAEGLGIDPDHCGPDGVHSFLISQPDYLEEGGENALDLIASGSIRMVIFDSLAEMLPQDEAEGDFAQRTSPANRARKIKALLMLLSPVLSKKDCAAIFINHMQKSIPMRYGEVSRETTPGGSGPVFHDSLRMRVVKAEQNKIVGIDPITRVSSKLVNSVDSRVTITKNKLGFAHRSAVVRITLGQGFDQAWSALQVLVANKCITKSGAWYYFNARGYDFSHPDIPVVASTGRPGIQGEEKVLDFAENHSDWKEMLIKTAEDTLSSNTDVYTYDAHVEEEEGFELAEDQEVLDNQGE